MEQKIKSIGTELKVTPSNLLLSTYFGQMFTNQVSVPVQISNNRFLLEFKESLALITKEADTLSDEVMRNILAIIVATYERLNVDETVDKLIDMGIHVSKGVSAGKKRSNTTTSQAEDEREVLTAFVNKIQERITQLSVESGLSNLLIQDVLTNRRDNGDLNLNVLGEISFGKIGTMVAWTQEFYALFVRQERGDTLAQLLAKRSSGSLLRGGRALYTLFRSGSGAYVQARENYVMDELFMDMTGRKLVDVSPLMKNKIYRVTGGALPDISFADAIAGYIWSLNTLQGIASDSEEGESMSISTMVDQIITGVGERVPFLPSEAGSVDTSRLEEHYKVVYLLHLVRRFLSDNPGEFYNRVQNSVQGNRFFKAEGVEKLFNEELYILSACFEAFRDTAFYYRDLYRNNQILFTDWRELNPLKRKQLTEFMESFVLGSANAFTYGIEHPAFYKQPGHLTTHTASSLAANPLDVSVYIAPEAWASSMHYILGGEDETFLRIGSAGIISGSWWDLPASELPYGRRLLDRAHRIQPTYTFKVHLPDVLLASSVVKQMYAIYPKNSGEFAQLRETDPALWEMVRRLAQERRFFRVTDLSMAMRLPLEIAEVIWDRAGEDHEFIDLSALEGLTFVMDPNVSRYYEFRQLSNERYVAPFVANYPVFVEEVDKSYIVEPLPAITGLGDAGKAMSTGKLNVADRKIPKTGDDAADDNAGASYSDEE